MRLNNEATKLCKLCCKTLKFKIIINIFFTKQYFFLNSNPANLFICFFFLFFDTYRLWKITFSVCDGIVLEIYLGHKFQWPQEGLNCESLKGNYFVCKRFTVQTLLWSLEFGIQINLEHDTIAVWNLARSWSISAFCVIIFLMWMFVI